MSDNAEQRRPTDLGGQFSFHVGPHDHESGTRWRVNMGDLCEIANEDRPYKAAAKLRELITEAQAAVEALEPMGTYREDRPAYETPATGAPIYCPAQPCGWYTSWDTVEEAETQQQRHVDEEHDGSRTPSREWQNEAMRRWRDQRERGWVPISAFDRAGDQ